MRGSLHHRTMKTQSSSLITRGVPSGPVTAVAALLCLLAPGTAGAASIVFTVANSNWNIAANWSPASVPTAADDAFIRVNRTVLIDSAVPSVTTVYLGSDNNSGTVNLASGGSLSISGNFEVMRRGTFTSATGILNMSGGSLAVGGNLYVGAGTGSNTNGSGTANISGGTIAAAITIGATGTGDGTGTFNVLGSAAIIGDGGASKNFTVNAFGTLAFTLDALGVSALNYGNGVATFGTGSTLNIDGSTYAGSGGDIVLINGGTLNGSATNVSITGLAAYNPVLVYNEGANGDLILRLSVVPEPGSLALAGIGAGLIGMRRRRSKALA